MASIISSGESSNGISIKSLDHMNVLDGGTANSTTVEGFGSLFVYSGGTANSTTVEGFGSMLVSSGGTADTTTINSGGYLAVFSGGRATNIIENGGYVKVADGASVTFLANTLNGLILDARQSVSVHSGTTANNTNVSGGTFEVNGGMVNNTTVNLCGDLSVQNGGTANSITINDGSLSVQNGTANSVTMGGGWLEIYEGGVVNSTTADGFGSMLVYSGGTANNTTINYGGRMSVSSGGTAINTTVNPGGDFYLRSGASANGTIINFNATLWISEGGTATNIIENGGYVKVADGATVTFQANSFNELTLREYESVTVHSGTTANSTTIGSEAELQVFSGGVANNTTVEGKGLFSLSCGGTANSATVHSGGTLFVSSGGTATSIIENGGYVEVAEGATVTFQANTLNGLILDTRQSATVHSGTTANNTTVWKYGSLAVFSGGTANSISVDSGYLSVAAGGTATNIVADASTRLYLTIASDTWVAGESAGSAFEFKNGKVSNHTVNGHLFLVSGGTAYNANVEGGSLCVFSGGMANDTINNAYGNMFISGGGTANNTTVDLRGFMCVYSGGTANNNTVKGGFNIYDKGNLVVSSGGTANNTTLDGGCLTIASGGTVNNVNVSNSGNLTVSGGGLANRALINSGGYILIEKGGTATISFTPFEMGEISSAEGASVVYLKRDTDVNVFYGNNSSGLVSSAKTFSGLSIDPTFSAIVYQNGQLDSATVSGGGVIVSSGGTANNTTFDGGRLTISSGGTAKGTILSGGSVIVASGGTVNGTVINGGEGSYWYNGWNTISYSGSMIIAGGGTATSTTVNSSGSLCVLGGGIADRTSVNASGRMIVSSGGTVTNIVWTPCEGHIVVADGAVITFAEQYSGVYFGAGEQLLSHAKTMDGENLGYSYEMYVMSDGTANNATVAGGSLCVFSGGTAKGAILSGGSIIVSDGGAASNTMISGGSLFISRGGTAARTTISGGEGIVSGGGTMNSVTMRQGQLTVLNGGEANSVYVYGGNLTDGHGSYTEQYSAANLYISGGAVVNSATVNGGFVYLNGTVNGVALRGSTYMSGKLYVNNGGIANGVVMSGGSLFVSNGGTVNDVSVESGLVTVSFGGIVSSMSVSSGGSMAVSGGKLTGRMSFADGATVTATKSWEATIDFNLTQTTPKNEVLLNNLSVIQGDFLYTLTVSDMQRKGLYRLAAKANDFYSTISIVNDLGTKLGSVGVGETAMIGDADYTLNLDNGVLTLLVEREGADDLTAPTVSDIKANTKDPARSVTVTAVFKDNIELKSSLYKLGENGAWMAYENGVTVTENVTIYFKAVDMAGNESAIKSYKVTNIKNADPIVPDVPDDGGNENADDGTVNGSIFDDSGNVKESFAESAGTVIDGDTSSIVLDEGVSQPDSTVGTYNNFVGYGDAVDYAKITLEKAANLSFEISATDAVKFTIYTLDEKTKKLKAVQTTTLKKTDGSKPTAAKLLEAGEYYISMQSTNSKKADAAAFYNVELGMADLYLDGDDNTNDWLYESGKKGRGLNTDVAGEAVRAKEVSRDSKGRQIQVDAKAVEHDPTGEYNNFVGFGDVTDYVKIHLDNAANLSLTVESGKAVKLTICQLTYKIEVANGSKTLVTTVLKTGNGSAASKLKLLEAGDYYVAVSATNAKKGDEAYYNVSVSSNSVFFDNCDDQTNDWLYEGGKKGRGENVTLVLSEGVTIVDTLKNVQIDASVPTGETGGWNNFVGYGDTDDYRKIVIAKDGATVSFKVDAKDQAKFVIYSYDKEKNKVKALQTSKLKKDGDAYSITTAEYTFQEAGEYYIAVTSTNAKKGGNAYYNVELVSTNVTTADLLGDAFAADLAMPEISSLNLTDDLSFSPSATDTFADASATSLAELDDSDKTGWLNIASPA